MVNEPFMNNMWEFFELIMNKSLLDRWPYRSFNFNLTLSPNLFCPHAFWYLYFPLPQAVLLSFVGLLASSLVWLVSHASAGLWAIHEQFMNNSWTKLDCLSLPTFCPKPQNLLRVWQKISPGAAPFLVSGFQFLLVSRFLWLPATSFWLPVSGFWLPASSFWLPASGFRLPASISGF